MKKYLLSFAILFVFSTVGDAAPPATTTAQPPSAATSAVAVPNAVTTSARVLIEAAALVASIRQAYSGATSYTVDFSSVQDVPKKKITDLRKEQLINKYKIIFRGPTDLAAHDYWLRINAVDGHIKDTVIIYAPDESGEFAYRVYNPLIPDGVAVAVDDPRVSDVPRARIHYRVEELERFIAEPGAEVKITEVEHLTILEIIHKGIFKKRENVQKVLTYIDRTTKYIVKQEIKFKNKESYRFRSEMNWENFVMNPEIADGDFLSKPEFNKE